MMASKANKSMKILYLRDCEAIEQLLVMIPKNSNFYIVKLTVFPSSTLQAC